MKPPKVCPICKKEKQEGSGGWATDFVCGTRFGNLSQSLVWLGLYCNKPKKLNTQQQKLLEQLETCTK